MHHETVELCGVTTFESLSDEYVRAAEEAE